MEHQKVIKVLWNIVYWGSLICGSINSQFLTRYWQSGHFKVAARIKFVLKVGSIVIYTFRTY